MKTPREILFAHHRDAEPRLDEVRRKALAAASGLGAADVFQSRRGASIFGMAAKVWWELIWPSRRAWAGIAAAWVVVLGANLEMKVTSPAMPAARAPSTREMVQAVEEQRRVLAELLPPATQQPLEPPLRRSPRANPRPRSEGPQSFKTC